ncbi:MAG: methyltransferase domain-containing protein, partial [Treponema sp.]|nr:methyltransferase domain-containing protein [Treponema sp.]
GRLSKVFYKLIYDNIELSDSDQVLDVGCGTGTILKTLSERFNIVAHGIDVENEMLKVAKTKCPEMDIQLCSCDSTPFEDDSIDAAIACMAYHHFPDKEAFEKEAARILKPDARLYIADPNFPFVLRKIINFLVRNLNGEFFSSKEITERFERSGFKLVNVRKRGYGQLVVLEKL